jgi:hypothetical protein
MITNFDSYVYIDVDETIEEPVMVTFNYTPAQMCGTERGQEGFPASVELETVVLLDRATGLNDFIDELSDYDRDRLEEMALEMTK